MDISPVCHDCRFSLTHCKINVTCQSINMRQQQGLYILTRSSKSIPAVQLSRACTEWAHSNMFHKTCHTISLCNNRGQGVWGPVWGLEKTVRNMRSAYEHLWCQKSSLRRSSFPAGGTVCVCSCCVFLFSIWWTVSRWTVVMFWQLWGEAERGMFVMKIGQHRSAVFASVPLIKDAGHKKEERNKEKQHLLCEWHLRQGGTDNHRLLSFSLLIKWPIVL